jgi:hypothetical protein
MSGLSNRAQLQILVTSISRLISSSAHLFIVRYMPSSFQICSAVPQNSDSLFLGSIQMSWAFCWTCDPSELYVTKWSYSYWGLADSMAEFYLLLPEMWQTLRTQFMYNVFAQQSCLITLHLPAPVIGSWWSLLGLMALSLCDSWWMWWSDTLWVTPTRLWTHSFLYYLF